MTDRARPFRSLAARLAPLVAVGLALSACGFRPMDAHAPNQAGSPELARIDIAPIPDRIGQVMRAGIDRRLNPTGAVADTAYVLRVTYTKTTASRGLRSDDSAARNDFILSATFQLTSVAKNDAPAKTLLKGVSTAVTRHNNPEQLYAGYVSARAAEERAAEMAAEDIARQLRLYFRFPENYPELKTTAPEPVEHTRPTRP